MSHPPGYHRHTPKIRMVDILRHGEVAGGGCFRGTTDDPLTAAGRLAMMAVVERLAPWDKVITSPLMRCQQVALALSESLDIPLQTTADFREIFFGDWEGLRAEQIMATDSERLQKFWQNPERFPPPGGEDTVAFQQRVITVWRELCGHQQPSRQLLITHGGVVRAILSDLLGISLQASFAFDVPLASITRIQLHTSAENNQTTAYLAAMGVVGC